MRYARIAAITLGILVSFFQSLPASANLTDCEGLYAATYIIDLVNGTEEVIRTPTAEKEPMPRDRGPEVEPGLEIRTPFEKEGEERIRQIPEPVKNPGMWKNPARPPKPKTYKN